MVALVVALVRVPRWIAGALRSLPDDGCRALALVACGSRSMAPAVRFAVGLPDGLQGFCRGFAVSSWAWSLSMIPGVDSWAVSSSRADDGCGGGALACHRKNHPPKKSQRTKANICWRGLCPGIDLAGRWSLAALAQWLRRCALRSGSLMDCRGSAGALRCHRGRGRSR